MSTTTPQVADSKVPVTVRALIQRINRKLAPQYESLCVVRRGNRAEVELGRYYLRDDNNNSVVGKHRDPEAIGRELGVLRPWEVVVE